MRPPQVLSGCWISPATPFTQPRQAEPHDDADHRAGVDQEIVTGRSDLHPGGDDHSAGLRASPHFRVLGRPWRGFRNPAGGARVSNQFSSSMRRRLTDRLFFAIFPDLATAVGYRPAGRRLARHAPAERPAPLAGRSGSASPCITWAITPACGATSWRWPARRPRRSPRRRSRWSSTAPPASTTATIRSSCRAAKGWRPGRPSSATWAWPWRGPGSASWWTRASRPHVTMLYDRRLVAEQTIEPVRWTVGGFTLIHSLLGRTEHIPLGRWALG